MKFRGWSYYSLNIEDSIKNTSYISTYTIDFFSSEDSNLLDSLSKLEIWSEKRMTNEPLFLFYHPVRFGEGENLIIKKHNTDIFNFFYLNKSKSSFSNINGNRSIVKISNVKKDTIKMQVNLKDSKNKTTFTIIRR